MVYSKYRAKKTVVDGITFDSKKEADFYHFPPEDSHLLGGG